MSSSDSDESNGGALTGFAWGNIQEKSGKIDDEDLARYPKVFGENIENEKVTLMSAQLHSTNSSDDGGDADDENFAGDEKSSDSQPAISAAILDASVSANPLTVAEARRAHYQNQADDDDEDDIDFDEVENDETHREDSSVKHPSKTVIIAPVDTRRSSQATKKFKSLMPSPRLSQEIEESNSTMYKVSSHVLKIDSNGDSLLSFNTLFPPLPTLPFSWLHHVRKPAPLHLPSCRTLLADDDADCFFKESLPLVEEKDSANHSKHSESDALKISQWKSYSVGEYLCSENYWENPLQPAMFTLLEQREWEEDIVWEPGTNSSDKLSSHNDVADKFSVLTHTSNAGANDAADTRETEAEDMDFLESDIKEFIPTSQSFTHDSSKKETETKIKKDSAMSFTVHFGICKRRRRARSKPLPLKALPTSNSIEQKSFGDIIINHSHTPLPIKNTVESLENLLGGAINQSFASMKWMNSVVWDENDVVPIHHHQLILDRNDHHIIFQRLEDFKRDINTTMDHSSTKPFDLSNDSNMLYAGYDEEFSTVVGKTGLQHALFALDHDRALFPTCRSSNEWLRWHRPSTSFPLSSSSVRLPTHATVVRRGGDRRKFVPKRQGEVSAKDGDIKLFEFIEERPLLVQSVGMVSELVTFYRERYDNDNFEPSRIDGDVLRRISKDKDDETPFLGKIRCGQTVHALNNNLYSAGVAEHRVKNTDFLLIRSHRGQAMRSSIYIREIPALCVVGPVQPKCEVPGPNSRLQGRFMKQRLHVYIYQRLLDSRRVQIAEIFAAFPDQSETAIRAKLKDIAVFHRSGVDSGWWTLREDKIAPRSSELHEMVTPEALCAYESMQAGKYYLDRTGLEVLTLTPLLESTIAKMKPENPLKRPALIIDQELRLSPWSLVENFLTASKGRCMLRLKGPGNPMGRGEALCYLRAPTRSGPDIVEEKMGPATALTGTNKDLRKLNMHELKDVLLSFGVPTNHIDKLLRWDRVKLVREKVSEAARNGDWDNEWVRFARAGRSTYKSMNRQFLKDAQGIFERQCEVLARERVEDEEKADNTDDDLDNWAEDLYADMLEQDMETQKTTKQSNQEDDDATEFRKFITDKKRQPTSDIAETPAAVVNDTPVSNTPKRTRKVIKRCSLRRTIRSKAPDGTERTTVTILHDTAIIEAFKNDQKDCGKRLQQLLASGKNVGLAPKKAKRTLVGDKKRRRPVKRSRAEAERRIIKRRENAQKIALLKSQMIASNTTDSYDGDIFALTKKRGRPKGSKNKPREFQDSPRKRSKVRCSACGSVGHTRMNKNCPIRLQDGVSDDASVKPLVLQLPTSA